MLKQLRKSSEQEIVDGYMSRVINEYYVMEQMWVRNAKEHRDDFAYFRFVYKSAI